MVSLSGMLGVYVGAGKDPHIFLAYCSVLYMSEKDKVDFMLERADYFIANQIKMTIFHLMTFCNASKPAEVELLKMYSEHATEKHPSFQLFMTVNLQ